MNNKNESCDRIGNLILIGLSHKTAPVETRELFSLPQSQISGFYERLLEAGVDESVYVSTCNRVEIYMTADDVETAVETIKKLMEFFTKLPHEQFKSSVYTKYGTDAVRHLLGVASSLDSMVVGENEITGQIKNSFRDAVDCNTTGPVLNRLFHRAFTTSKRVRTETGISRNPLSIASIAVDQGKAVFPDLSDRSVLLIGAGEMGELILKYLVKEKLSNITIANRTVENAERICEEIGYDADVIPFAKLDQALAEVDIVISSVTAPHHVISADDVREIMLDRDDNSLFLIDIAVPRNVEPSVEDIDNVFLYNIDSLREIADNNLKCRMLEIDKANCIIDEEVADFVCWYDEHCLAPTIAALKNKFNEIRLNEIQKYTKKKLKHLSEKDLQIIEELTGQIMKKTLHNPIMNLKKYTTYDDETKIDEGQRFNAKFVEDLFTKC